MLTQQTFISKNIYATSATIVEHLNGHNVWMANVCHENTSHHMSGVRRGGGGGWRGGLEGGGRRRGGGGIIMW